MPDVTSPVIRTGSSLGNGSGINESGLDLVGSPRHLHPPVCAGPDIGNWYISVIYSTI